MPNDSPPKVGGLVTMKAAPRPVIAMKMIEEERECAILGIVPGTVQGAMVIVGAGLREDSLKLNLSLAAMFTPAEAISHAAQIVDLAATASEMNGELEIIPGVSVDEPEPPRVEIQSFPSDGTIGGGAIGFQCQVQRPCAQGEPSIEAGLLGMEPFDIKGKTGLCILIEHADKSSLCAILPEEQIPQFRALLAMTESGLEAIRSGSQGKPS